jgi:hypothetical protein
MLEHQLLSEGGMLIVRPKGPLTAGDFTALAADADAYIEKHGALKGLMICAPEFPGWENLDGAISHFKFLRDYERKIRKVAVVSDSDILAILPAIARHFVSAEVKHFKACDEDAAVGWIAE